MIRLTMTVLVSTLALAGCPSNSAPGDKAPATNEVSGGSAAQPNAPASQGANPSAATQPAPGRQATSQPGAAAKAPAPEVVTDPSANALPTVTDFEGEADQSITKDNYRKAYKKIETEVSSAERTPN